MRTPSRFTRISFLSMVLLFVLGTLAVMAGRALVTGKAGGGSFFQMRQALVASRSENLSKNLSRVSPARSFPASAALMQACPANLTVTNGSTGTWVNTSPSAVNIRITALGAGGGKNTGTNSGAVNTLFGGSGASITGEFIVAPGESVFLIAGAPGQNSLNGGSGGGGSGAVNCGNPSNCGAGTILLLAGGGGGTSGFAAGGGGRATSGGGGGGTNNSRNAAGGGGLNAAGQDGIVIPGDPTFFATAKGGGQVSKTGLSNGGAAGMNNGIAGAAGGNGMGGGGASDGGGYAAGGGGQTGGNGEDDAGGNNGGYSLPGGTNQTNTAGANGSGANQGSVTLTCLGTVSAPEIAVSETGVGDIADNGSFSFGTTTVGAPVTKTFTVTNSGTANLTLSNLSVPSGFSIASNFGSTTVAGSGGMTTFQITMLAAGAGSPSGTLTFDNNDADENPFNFTISGSVFAPPTVSKFFVNPNQANSNNTSLNGTARLAIAITNPPGNPGSLNGLAITDTFPAGLEVDSPVVSNNTCGGAFAPSAGATSISLSGGGPLTAGNQCSIFVVVKATIAGVIPNTTGNVSSTEGGAGGTDTALLNVFAPPTIAKSFGASVIQPNGVTTMSFTITNPAGNQGNLTGVGFMDTLLSSLQIAGTPGLTTNNSCGAATLTGFTAGSTSLTVSNATIAPNMPCTITVNVTATTAGTINNTTTAVTSTNGGTGATSNTATLMVGSPPTVTKSFSPTQILVGGASTLTINFTNPNASTPLTNLSISDIFPAGVEVDATPMATSTCGGSFNPAAAATSISLSGGSLGTGVSNTCSISVKVKGTTAGDKINTTGNVSSAETGQGGTASATLTVVGPPTISKGFGIPVNIAAAPTGATESGNTVTITTAVAHGLAIGQRVLISGVGVAGYNGTFSIASVPSSTTFTYDNPTAGLAASGDGAASRVSVPLNSTTTMRFVLTNPNPSTTLNNVSFSDMLPSGITVASNGAGVSTCNGGTLVTTAPGTVSFTGGVLAAAANCTIDVTVTGATAGSWNNTTTAISATETGTGAASNTANLLVVAPPAIVKSFNPAAIAINGVTRLSFSISNPNPRILPSNESPLNEPATLFGVQFSVPDMLPSGLQTANPSMATVSNCGSSQTMGLNPGNTSINLLNARVVIGFPCVVSLNVTGTQAGTFNNSVTITSANGGLGNTSMATLLVANPPTVTKAFSPSLITPGGTSTLTVTLSNSNTFDLTGASVTDTLPVGVTTVGGTAATTCTGGTASQNSGSVSLSGGTIPMGGSCTLSVNVTSAANGIYTNTIAAGAVTTADSGPNASPASAVLTVANPPTISKAFAPNPISSGGTGTLTITLLNPNSNAPLTLSSPLVDTLPVGVTTVAATNANTCGGAPGQTSGMVALTGGTIPANGSCTLTVNVTSSTVGGHLNTIAAGALVTNGGSNANPASATLFVGEAPLITKSFGSTAIKHNDTTSLTISIANNNVSLPFNGVSFTDTLPAGLTVPDAAAVSMCGGTLTVSSNVITLTGATIAAGTTCTTTFTATGATVGVKNNTVTVNTSNFGTGYTGTGTVTVYDVPTIAKSFSPTSVPFGGTSTMSFVLSNPNSFAGGNLTGLSFTDTLPSGIAVGTSGPASVCGGTLMTTAPNMVSFSGGTLGISGPGNACTINVTVTGAQTGMWTNTVTSLASTQTGTNAVSTMATLTVNQANSLTTITSDNPDSSATGQTVTVDFTVAAVAPGAGTPTGTVTISVSGGAETCTGTLAAGVGSCTLALTVPGSRTLTATYNGDTNFNGSTGTEPHTVVAPPVIAKSFNPTAVLLNGVTTLTLFITNPAANTVALTGVGVTDAFLPTAPGLVVHTTPAVMNSCATGTFNPIPGDMTLTLSGAIIPVGTTCNFSVQVRATSAGTQVNNTGQVTSTNGGTGNSASATLQANSPPAITPVNLSRAAGSAPLTTTIAAANDVETPKNQLVVQISTDGTNFFDSVTAGNVIVALVDQNAGAANVNPAAAGDVIAAITTPCNATAGPLNLFLRVTDSDGQMDTKPWMLTIIPNPSPVLSYINQTVSAGTTPTINPAIGTSDNGTITSILLQSVAPNNGGLTVSVNNVTGQVQVTGASLIGSYAVNIAATDNCSATTMVTLTVNVVCPTITLSPASLPNTTVNTAYAQTISASPSGGSYTFALTSGSLPAGLTLNSNGSFSGAPTVSGTFNFRVTATGFGGCTAFRDYSLVVICPSITINPASLPGGLVGAVYNQTVAGSPAGAYSYSVTSGSLPAGLTLNASTGAITGTPTTTGSFNLTITATAGSCSGSRTYTVAIACPAITLSPASPLPGGQAGVAYSQTISVSPAGSYTFSLISGSLPSGVTLNPATGVVSGLPSNAGSFTFTVKAQTAGGCSATQSYTLAITCPAVTLSPASLPGGSTGVAYSQTVSASPGGGGYSYAVTTGTLPAGLSLNSSTGILSGTPATAGSFTFRITGTGFSGCTGSRDYSVVIGGGSCPTVTLPASLPNGNVGQLYNAAATASPAGLYSYTVTGGSVPPGVTLFGANGLLFGYPTAVGTYPLTITATQGACSGSRTYTVLIGAGMASSLTVFSDFDGDGKSDLSVWRGSDGNWLVANSGDGQLQATAWGSSASPYNDVIVSGDYDGDGKTDLAVFRRGGVYAGYWFIKQSRDGQVSSHFWGLPTDIPVPGDYDGDGKTDVAVWRGSAGAWYILRSSDGEIDARTWGYAPADDIPVPGDFDGDSRTDVAVFRRSTGFWYIRRSSDSLTISTEWGVGTDVPVPGDYDGDGKTDLAVWRGSEGAWHIIESGSALLKTLTLGAAAPGDVPAVADYDGDGKADLALWQASTGTWTIKRSRDNVEISKIHGQSGDVPIMSKRN